MPNLDPWINQSEYDQRISTAESTKLEKHLQFVCSNYDRTLVSLRRGTVYIQAWKYLLLLLLFVLKFK
jgi:hypothetical protein